MAQFFQTSRSGIEPRRKFITEPYDCAVQEAHHRTITYVLADRCMINVMRQAYNESKTFGNRRNFYQRHSRGDNQVPQERNVYLKGRNFRILNRLSFVE